MKKHIKKVHCHTKKIFKAMDKHAHAFMLFLGGLFLIVMASSTQQLMGTHAAIDEISSTTNQIQDLSPEEVIGNIKGLGVIKEALVNVVTYFQQVFTSFHDTVIAKFEEVFSRIKELETRTNNLENQVKQIQVPTTNTLMQAVPTGTENPEGPATSDIHGAGTAGAGDPTR